MFLIKLKYTQHKYCLRKHNILILHSLIVKHILIFLIEANTLNFLKKIFRNYLKFKNALLVAQCIKVSFNFFH